MTIAHRIPLEPDASQGTDTKELAEKLRYSRSARGLTEARHAELLEVSPLVYNRWETGAATTRFATVVRIADILDVTLNQLAGREEPDDYTLNIRNPENHTLFRQFDPLSNEDQRGLVVLIDSLVNRSQFKRLMAS